MEAARAFLRSAKALTGSPPRYPDRCAASKVLIPLRASVDVLTNTVIIRKAAYEVFQPTLDVIVLTRGIIAFHVMETA
jgi:hypothetical protein